MTGLRAPETTEDGFTARLRTRATGFAERHPVLVRRARTAWIVWTWLSILWLIVALVFVPWLWQMLKPWLWCYLMLIWVFLAARSKTLSWRFTALVFTAGAVGAVGIGLTELAIAGAIDADVNAPDGAVLIAGPVEESLKLAPLLVLLVFARRRARGFAVTDYLLVGFASGAAFQALESAVRRTAYFESGAGTFGLLADLLGREDAPPIPHTVSGHGWLPYHAAGTALIAVAIGLAVRGRSRFGVALWVLPALAFAMVTTDHAMYNYRVVRTSSAEHAIQLPDWLPWLHEAGGRGALWRPMLLGLWIVAMVADTRRVHQAWPVLPGIPALPVPTAIRNGAWRAAQQVRELLPYDAAPIFHRLIGTLAGAIQWTGIAVADMMHDAALTVLAAANDTEPVPEPPPPTSGDTTQAAGMQRPRRHRWFAAMFLLRTRRQLAHEAVWLQNLRERRIRRAGHTPAMLGAAVLVALLFAAAPGPAGIDVPGFLASLFDNLADWWDGLSPVQQLLVGAGGAALLTLGGLGFWGALGVMGGATMLASHGHGAADFLRDPRKATGDFVRNLTPQQMAGYAAELALARMLPGGLGATQGRRLRHSLDDLANDPRHWLQYRRRLLGDLGAADFNDLIGRKRAAERDFQLPAKDHKVPGRRVNLATSPDTINKVLDLDPRSLSPSERALWEDYRQHLTGPNGRSLTEKDLANRIADLRKQGRKMSGTGKIPNAKYAGQRVFLKDTALAGKYPDGVYFNLKGYPDFDHLKKKSIPFATTGDRRKDIKTVNIKMQKEGQVLNGKRAWDGLASGDTPDGHVWHHVEGGKRMILIPRDIHEEISHAGGIATAPP